MRLSHCHPSLLAFSTLCDLPLAELRTPKIHVVTLKIDSKMGRTLQLILIGYIAHIASGLLRSVSVLRPQRLRRAVVTSVVPGGEGKALIVQNKVRSKMKRVEVYIDVHLQRGADTAKLVFI